MSRPNNGEYNDSYERQKEQRRRDVRRRKRRRRGSNLLIYIMLMMLIASVAVILSLTVFFKVDTISTSDSGRYTAEQIIAASGLEKGVNLFLADTSAAAKNIQERLPYITDVRIRRSLPSTISIVASEGEPERAYSVSEGYALTCGEKVVEIVSERPQKLIVFTEVISAVPGQNIELDSEVSNNIEQLIAAADSHGLQNLTEIHADGALDISAVYDGRLLLQFGTVAELDKKMANAIKIIESTRNKYGASVEGTINLKWLDDGNDSYFTRGAISSDAVSSSAASSEGASSAEPASSADSTASTVSVSSAASESA
jgi:cell division protein FtsQ